MEGYQAHETAVIDEGCQIGQGTRIWHFSHLMAGCVVGERCNIGQNVVVSPGVVLGDGVKVQNNVSIYTGVICEDEVFLGPSCVFTNVINPRSAIVRKDQYRQTLVRRGASIGANATIVCGHTIGQYAMIGAGAVVTKLCAGRGQSFSSDWLGERLWSSTGVRRLRDGDLSGERAALSVGGRDCAPSLRRRFLIRLKICRR